MASTDLDAVLIQFPTYPTVWGTSNPEACAPTDSGSSSTTTTIKSNVDRNRLRKTYPTKRRRPNRADITTTS